jgi:hemolysin activation/secretion protein
VQSQTPLVKAAFGLLILFAAHSVRAAAPPTGGQLLQEVPAPTPLSAPARPMVTVVRPDASMAEPGEAFLVTQIDITGNTQLPPQAIHDLVASSQGKTLSLADLQRLAEKITALYENHGFPFSQAYIPAQTMREGHVQIAVLEARYDNVVLHNSSRVSDSVVQVPLAELKVGAPVAQATLDRVLLLESDLPGTEVKGTLRPGKTAGASELLVEIEPGPRLRTSVSADDYGNAATGRSRLNANVSFSNPLHAGDLLSMNALSSGNGMTYGRVGYEVPVYGPATQIEAHVSALGYRIVNGSEAALEAHGVANVYGLTLQSILLRQTDVNVTAQLTYDETLLRDHIDVSALRTDRHTQDWRASIAGSVNDGTGSNNFSAGLTSGKVVFDDPTARLVDSSGARTGGQFVKFIVSVSRLQRISATTALFGSFNYQAADGNLDSSEQLFTGGPYSVRAYDNGIISGSQGDSISLELRQDLWSNASNRWQGTVFVDNAHVQIEKNAYSAGINNATLSGFGVGLNWLNAQGWSLISALSRPMGGSPVIAGHRDSLRAWVKIEKDF